MRAYPSSYGILPFSRGAVARTKARRRDDRAKWPSRLAAYIAFLCYEFTPRTQVATSYAKIFRLFLKRIFETTRHALPYVAPIGRPSIPHLWQLRFAAIGDVVASPAHKLLPQIGGGRGANAQTLWLKESNLLPGFRQCDYGYYELLFMC